MMVREVTLSRVEELLRANRLRVAPRTRSRRSAGALRRPRSFAPGRCCPSSPRPAPRRERRVCDPGSTVGQCNGARCRYVSRTLPSAARAGENPNPALRTAVRRDRRRAACGRSAGQAGPAAARLSAAEPRPARRARGADRRAVARSRAGLAGRRAADAALAVALCARRRGAGRSRRAYPRPAGPGVDRPRGRGDRGRARAATRWRAETPAGVGARAGPAEHRQPRPAPRSPGDLARAAPRASSRTSASRRSR